MNIHELDSYDLGDAVKFNDKLNPRIWGADEKMRPEVREQLLKIADDFREFLGIDVEVKDITVSGSNAAYTYTPHSDIDLHLVVDLPEADANEVYRELFDAKKYAYNEQHDIRIGDYDVELYVQDANKKHHSQGIYSLMNNDWVAVPKRRKPDVDDISVKSKFEDLGHRIETAIKSQDYKKISAMAEKIRDYRQAGLDAHGEFGPENLAFKILRTQGLIKKLYDARNAAKDKLLSLDERRKKKKKKSVKYGYGGYWYPGTAYAGQDHPAGTEGGDGGGGDGGGESIREDAPTKEQTITDFVNFCVAKLRIEQEPQIRFKRDPAWSTRNRTFGSYNHETNELTVSLANRHVMDILRTVAHELTHQRQGEVADVPDHAGETGSRWENEANAKAGVLMREYGQLHPEFFDPEHTTESTNIVGSVKMFEKGDTVIDSYGLKMLPKGGRVVRQDGYMVTITDFDTGTTVQLPANMLMPFRPRQDLVKEASGYIPTQAQAHLPQFSNALSVDIRPGAVGKEANKLKLKTDRQGHPQIAKANGLFEDLYLEYKKYKADEDYSPDKPPGPEFKPTMPAGTLRVDVSDVYDWYKLGQHISNMDGLGQHDFGKGPPSAIISFGDEDTEHKFIDNIKATGLDVTDIDPADPVKRPGKKIKTDPTYNVDEAIQAPVSKQDRATQDYYKFIVGKIKLGRVLNRQEQEFLKMYNLKRQVAEYAVTPDRRDDEPQGPDYIEQLANRWWNAADPADQNRIADVIRTFGYEISQVESEDDAVQLTDRKSGHTYFISADDFDPDLFEISNELRQNYLRRAGQQVDRRQERIARVRDRLNKGYEIYHADRPAGGSQIVHRFEADTPALAQRYYEKYNANYESDQDYDLRLRRSTGIMESEEELDEVKMSPGALEKFAASKEAQGIRAGFEAELIFRDTQGDDEDDYDMEPDYDMDERANSIQQVIEFFSNDDYGYGLSDRQIRSLENELDEQYMNWRDERMTEDFQNEAEDLVRDQWLEERPMNERILSALSDGMGLDDAEADKILVIGDKAPRFTKSSDQTAYKEANPGYDKYLEAVDIADAILDEEVEASIDRQDGYYDQALDEFRDNYSGDDDSFFSDVGLRWMSDVANNFGLDWPYMTGGGNSNNGSRSWEEIGNSLQAVIDMPVKVSSNYHSIPRKEGQWIIEPDGSLDPDDKSDEVGLEIVSPPMPLLTAIEKLKQVTDWANNPSEGNAYTNRSTGLHMGVSIPFVGGDVDYVKLIMFMGDKYVLEQFGRASNTYTASAMNKLRQNLAGGRSDPAGVATLLKSNLAELAFKELQKGVGTSKYTSAHIQNGYIEFRSPGGDWLAKSNEDIGILENTMMRFAQAMYIASRADLERNEYAKKLYKLISEYSGDSDHLKMFAEFNAGMINKEQLKKQWAEKTIGTEKKMNQRWKLYQNVSGRWEPVPAAEWNGYTEDQVKNAVWSKYGREALESGEYKLVNMSEDQQWEVYDVKTGKTLEIVKGRNKGEVADAVYDKYIDQGIGFNVRAYVDPATLTPRAKLAKRIVEPKKQPTPSEQQAKNERGVPYWEVYEKETGHVVHTLLSDDLPDAVTDAYNWLQGIGAEQPDLFSVRAKMVPNPQTTDNRRDSADIQRRLGVQDIDTDVAQNFAPDYSAFERNSDRIDAIRAGQDATEVRRNWEFVDRITGQVVHSMANASYNQANAVQTNLEQQNPAADIYLRSVANLEENFADGKGPGRPGDSQRHGIPKGATIAQLEKAAKSPGRKGQLARWQLNMRRGKKK